MRRNVCRHAYGDAAAAVDQQVGIARRQDPGFFAGIIKGGRKIDGVFVDVREQLARDFCQTGFGVAVGRGGVTVDRAEVSLPVDQRVAHGKVLRHSD